MTDDIVTRLRHIERLSEPVAGKYIPDAAKESADEIERLRKEAADWKQTAQMLAMDLGHVEYASALYEDVQSGLYDKVRERIAKNGF